MYRWLSKIIFFLILTIGNYALATPSIFLAANEPPKGFEELSQNQQSLIDIYYGNRYLASQLIFFSPGVVKLNNSAEVVRLIGNLNDPLLITSALSGELNSNSELVCLPTQNQNCGTLNTPVAGVIFDESRFRVDIFINRRFMLTKAAEVRKYLPPSDAGFSLMQNFSASASGTTNANTENNYTLSGLSLIAFEENSLYSSWDYSRSNQFSVNSLYGQRDFEGFEYNIGLQSSQGFGLSFTSDQPIIGARIATSSNTREDLDFTGGTPLEVFLPLRGRVEIIRDGRLIDSNFHEAGLQQLDTSRLSDGAYDITIRILDELGNVLSEETRFFAKQYQLPPTDEWLLFAETGRIVSRQAETALPMRTDSWLARAGASRRLMDNMAATLAMASIDKDVLMEFGLYHLGYRYDISPSVMVSNQGSRGVSINGRTTFDILGGLYASANYRRLSQGNTSTLPGEPILLGSAFEQQSFSTGLPMFGGSINYRYSFNKSQNGTASQSNSVDYRRSLFRSIDYDADMTLSFSQSGDDRIALISMSLRLKEDRWSYRVSPRAEFRENNGQKDRTERVRLSASWDDQDLFEGNMRLNGGVETGSGDERFDTSATYSNHYGSAGLSISYAQPQSNANSVTSYTGSFSSSFLTDGQVVAFGGEQTAESALVVDLDGRDGDTFDVTINGQRRGYAVAGTPSIIPLSPFEQYTISLSPAGETLYNFDEREKISRCIPAM